MKKRWLILILSLPAFMMCCQKATAQNFNFSQYGNAGSWMNPSQPSLVQESAVRLNYRIQSIGNQQAIQSGLINASYPWLARKGNASTSSLGLMVLDDKIAPVNGLSFQTVGLSLSYAVSLSKHQRLSFGLMPSYGMHRMDHQGLRTISQYSQERGYMPAMPLNEPLLNARGSFFSWNTGLSWRKTDTDDQDRANAGLSFYNINGPSETFQTFENSIPLAMQAYFSTTVYENRFYRLMPEVFYSSYGNSYQLQMGGRLHYSLRHTNLRQGQLILGSRYNLSKAVIFLLQFEQPAYVFGLSTDLYTSRESPFSHAFELSMGLRQAVIGNSARKWRMKWKPNWNWRGKGNKKTNKSQSTKRGSKPGKGDKEFTKKERYVKERVKLPVITRHPYLEAEIPELEYVPEKEMLKKIKLRKGELSLAAFGRDIHFQTGSAQLSEESLPALKEVAEVLLTNPSFRIRIVGHTDDVGGPEFNRALSLERAEVVKKALIAHGVEDWKIETQGAGMSSPLLPNTSTLNRQLNRRVEFMLFQEQDKSR